MLSRISFRISKIRNNFPIKTVLCVFIVVLIFYFVYYFPFTNNAFVAANIRPVAANVSGYVTDIYVKNEEYVKVGQPLFTVFKKPYELAYQNYKAKVASAKARLISLQKQVEITQHSVKAQRDVYKKVAFEYQHYQLALRDSAVPKVTVHNLLQEKNTAWSTLKALEKTLEKDKQDVIVQRMNIKSLIAHMHNAKVDLDETTVYAKNNGIVQNMFVALGAPVEIRKPLFSFIDTDHMFIQANFNETDLRNVKAGNKVTIYPRIYFWKKTYHGVIISKNWAASRQVTDPRSQEQIVTNSENNWFLLPQRFPVQILITDYDPEKYPLSVGSSAYVYIHS